MAARTGRPYKLQVLSTNGERKLQGSANNPTAMPTYNIPVEQRMGVRPVEEDNRANNVYGDAKLAAALEGCGISPQQLKGLVDWYLNNTGTGPGTHRPAERQTQNSGMPEHQDFHQPAHPPPGVVYPAYGANRQAGAQASNPVNQWNSANPKTAPPGVSCFACGRRGHYSMTCPYPLLPPNEQEKLREAARISRLQKAGLPIPINRQAVVHAVQSHDPGPKIEEIKTTELTEPPMMNKASVVTCPEEITTSHSTLQGDRAARISSACAILSRLPPVMAAIQDVMAGKRARTQGEDSAEPGAYRGPKAPRMRGFFQGDDMEDAEY